MMNKINKYDIVSNLNPTGEFNIFKFQEIINRKQESLEDISKNIIKLKEERDIE